MEVYHLIFQRPQRSFTVHHDEIMVSKPSYEVENIDEDEFSHGNNSISVAAEVLGIVGPYQVVYQDISYTGISIRRL